MKSIIQSFFISVILFFAISFLSLLPFLNSPFIERVGFKGIRFGFPYNIYYDFIIDCNQLNHSWNGNNIIWNFIIILIFVFGIQLILKKLKKDKC